MDPRLERIALQITQQHPNLIRPFWKNIKANLPFGLGEDKVKDALADNIPIWVYKLSVDDLREFDEMIHRDPEYYEWLRFNIQFLAKIIYDQ